MANEFGGVIHDALGQEGLFVKHFRPKPDSFVVGVSAGQDIEVLDDRAFGIQFENAFADWSIFTHDAHDPLHIDAHVAFGRNEAAGAVGEALGRANVFDAIPERLFDGRHGILDFFVGFFRVLLIVIAEIDIAVRNALQLALVVLVRGLDEPFVYGVGHEHDVITAFLEGFDMGALFQRFARRAGDVIDILLRFGHRFDVLRQRNGLSVGRIEGLEAAQISNGVAVFPIGRYAFFEDFAVFTPNRVVLLDVGLGHFLERLEHQTRNLLLDLLDGFVLLEHLARDVQRQILGIDDAAEEAHINRDEFVRVLHDEHALGIKTNAVTIALE